MQANYVPAYASLRLLPIEYENGSPPAAIGAEDRIEGQAVRLAGEPDLDRLTRDEDAPRPHPADVGAFDQSRLGERQRYANVG